MKKIQPSPGAFIVITTCLIFLWLPVFISYYGLLEADFLTTNLSYENMDLDLLPAGQKTQSLSWDTNSGFIQWPDHPLGGPDAFHILMPSFDQNNPMLRC